MRRCAVLVVSALLVLIGGQLAGCGQKGPLYLPQPAQGEPVRSEPVGNDPVRNDPVRSDPAGIEPGQSSSAPVDESR